MKKVFYQYYITIDNNTTYKDYPKKIISLSQAIEWYKERYHTNNVTIKYLGYYSI